MNHRQALSLALCICAISACTHLSPRSEEMTELGSGSMPADAHWTTVPTQTIKAGELTFAYREMGVSNDGVPVIFLLHLGAVLDNWDPNIVNAIASQRHIVAFDNRGVGATSGEPADSIEQMAKDAVLFIRAKGYQKVDLLGFSMGGMIAQQIALNEPELIRKMVIAGTGPAGGEGIKDIVPVTYGDMFRGYLTFQDPKQFLFFTRSPEGIRAGKEFLARIALRKEHRDTEIELAAFSAQLTAIENWGKKQPADLMKITQPVLVVNGDDDRMVPTKNTYDLAKRLPHAELIIYPDAGHGSIFQFHQDFAQKALAFLSAEEPPAAQH